MIHAHLRRPRQIRRVVAAAAFSGTTDLQQELSCASKREDVGVLLTVAADPDAVFCIDGNSMHLLRPLVAVSWTSPGLNDATFSIEFNHRRRGHASGLLHRFATVNDPDVVASVGRNPADGAHGPIVGKRFRPAPVHFEDRYLGDDLCLCGRHSLAARPRQRDEDDADD
jgi:hypothetical protein